MKTVPTKSLEKKNHYVTRSKKMLFSLPWYTWKKINLCPKRRQRVASPQFYFLQKTKNLSCVKAKWHASWDITIKRHSIPVGLDTQGVKWLCQMWHNHVMEWHGVTNPTLIDNHPCLMNIHKDVSSYLIHWWWKTIKRSTLSKTQLIFKTITCISSQPQVVTNKFRATHTE